MSFSSKFKIVEKLGEHFVLFSEFFGVLKGDSPQLRQSNLRKSINKYYKAKIETVEDEEYVRVFAVLKYCFQHSDSSKVCQDIANYVTSCICKDNSANFNSSFELYKLISKTSFHEKTTLLDLCHFDEENIETLIYEHKSHFTEREWKKICWFESHFSKYINKEHTYHDIEYERLIDLKYSKFHALLNFKQCQDILNKLLPLNIKEIQGRLHTQRKKTRLPFILNKDIYPTSVQ